MINKRLLISGGSIPSILSYSITPSSISGTSTSTLTHSVIGDAGATFTLSVTGATVHTMGPGGTFSTTSSQGARSLGAGAITRTYTATNTIDPINALTDTVYQGAGPARTYNVYNWSWNVSVNGTSYSNGSSTSSWPSNDFSLFNNSYTYGASFSFTMTATLVSKGNSRSIAYFQGINSGTLSPYYGGGSPPGNFDSASGFSSVGNSQTKSGTYTVPNQATWDSLTNIHTVLTFGWANMRPRFEPSHDPS